MELEYVKGNRALHPLFADNEMYLSGGTTQWTATDEAGATYHIKRYAAGIFDESFTGQMDDFPDFTTGYVQWWFRPDVQGVGELRGWRVEARELDIAGDNYRDVRCYTGTPADPGP